MVGLRDLFGSPSPTTDADPTTDAPRPSQALGGLSRLREPAPAPARPLSGDVPPASRIRQPSSGPVRLPRRKTSISISPALQERISTAFHRDRWTMAELVAEGVRRMGSGRIEDSRLDESVRVNCTSSASIRTVALGTGDLDELDRRAGRLRLSRSQLVAALVALVLDDL